MMRGGADYALLETLAPIPDDPTYDDKCNARANFVKFMLHSRLEYVKKGHRARDFVHWVRRNKGETAPILSDKSGDDDDRLNHAIHNPAVPLELERAAIARLKHDPFAADRMNLGLVLTSQNPQDCFDSDTSTSSNNNNDNNNNNNKPPSYWQLTCRAVTLGLHFCPVWSTAGLALVAGPRFRQKVWYPWLARAIGSSGAAWIKWGQWSSTRNDMFPDALCDELSQLHAAAPAHSFEYSQQQVEQALGLGRGTLGCVFDEFDPQPIASGSIAQIHKANLCGVNVAVKVRHPRVQQLMDLDFRLMTAAAAVVDKLPALKWLHIRESVEQFSHTMAAQAYLQVEAHHLEVLNYNFRRWPTVKFPTPFFASSAVIIETFEPGVISTDIIDKYDQAASKLNGKGSDGVTVEEVDDGEDNIPNDKVQAEEDEKAIAGHDLMPLELSKFLVSTGVGVYLKMLLVDNLMHADLHPGNIMVSFSPSSKEKKALSLVGGSATSLQQVVQSGQDVITAMDDAMENIKITLVDAGMVTKLSDEESAAFIGLMACLGEGDGAEAAHWALQFSVDRDVPEKQRQAFQNDMQKLFEERCRGYGTNVDVGDVLRGVLGLVRTHRVRIDANFATLVINALCIESLARRVCPSYNVLDAAKPLLRGYYRLQKRKGSAKSSKIFALRMAANALKKEIGDRHFFEQEAQRKKQLQQRIAEQIQSSSV